MSDAIFDTLIPRTFGGRLVTGNPMVGYDKDDNNVPLTDKKGNQIFVTRFAVALPKGNPESETIIREIKAFAHSVCPSRVDAAGNSIGKFALKIKDGDSTEPDQGGTRWCDKEGHPGNWIVQFKTSINFPCYSRGFASQLTNPSDIKTGDFIRVGAAIKYNNNATNPGLYVNPACVELVCYGDAINPRFDHKTLLAKYGEAAVPPGGTLNPPATTPPPATPAAVPQPPAVSQPPVAPTQPPVAPTQPPVAVPQPPVAPQPAILQPPVMGMYRVYQGAKYTEDQLRGWNWTEAQINALPKG